jgi:hypothetical protein
MSRTNTDRLTVALAFLGCTDEQSPQTRSNLLHAIMLFAVARKDGDLERACASTLQAIKSTTGQ